MQLIGCALLLHSSQQTLWSIGAAYLLYGTLRMIRRDPAAKIVVIMWQRLFVSAHIC
jgi:threonine/homoserine/homoserine lactone efflux protein